MYDEQIRIIRGTILWGALTSAGAAILSALGIPIAPWSVALGATFAVIAVKFYAAVVLVLFQRAGASFQFGVWFLIKLVTVAVLVWLALRSSEREILSFIAGTLVFIPAAFRYAFEEASRESESAAEGGGDEPPSPPVQRL